MMGRKQVKMGPRDSDHLFKNLGLSSLSQLKTMNKEEPGKLPWEGDARYKSSKEVRHY